MIKVIEEHSIDLDFLTGGWVIDAGCLRWKFSQAMKDLGEKIFALDINEMEKSDCVDIFERKALSYKNDVVKVFVKSDLAATHTSDVCPTKVYVDTFDVPTITLNDIRQMLTGEIDVLKLDIEGGEYTLLTNNFVPIAKQISIEFHEHCFPELHKEYFPKCLKTLQEHYDVAYLERVPMHCAGLNYWDSLFIKKS